MTGDRHMALQATGVAIWEYDPTNGKLWWPETDAGLLGASRIPETLAGMIELIEPDDRPRVERAFLAASEGGELEVEFRVLAGGRLRWLLSKGRLVTNGIGEPLLIGLVLDITTRKEAEQAIRESEGHKTAILSSIPDAVVISDPAGRVVSLNPVMVKLSGWTEKEIVGQPFDFYPMFDSKDMPIERDQRPIARALTAGKPVATRGYEQTMRSRDGVSIPVSVTAAPVFDDDGDLLGGVEVLRDVSYEREEDQIKSSLVSTVSHELRTPLTMIQGFSELVLTRPLSPDKSQEALRHISTSAQRLARLVEDLLTVSRIESGRTDPRLRPVPLEEVMTEIVGEFEDRRTVELDVEPGLGPVLADRDMLVQILTNLVSNAVKYSPPDAPISLRGASRGDHAEISVTDRGMGMSANERDHLFERFFRADRDEVRRAGGTGLGLYITKHLVELQRGQIWVETELGQGSTFSFSLPLAPTDETERAS
jgi:PAS domain S-box-containing protein